MSHRRQLQDTPKRRRHTFDYKDEQKSHIVSKQAFVFLCLFDGFRIPSIRRLTRKPRTICFEPLINYDPCLSSPATKTAIDGRYNSLLHVNCHSVIDPSTNQVNQLISRTFSRQMNERIIIHYFGQGSIKPSKGGQVFFFDSNHHSYRGLNISKVVGSVSTSSTSKETPPVVLILDVNGAGALIPELNQLVQTNCSNLIAFLSCDEDENLPSAPSFPNDILSSSILFPSKMAVYFHAWRSSFNSKEVSLIFTQTSNENFEKYTKISSNDSFLSFLNSVIDSIAFSKLDQETYEKYLFEDPSLATITRGFILAQRILKCHNIHAKSVPDLPDFSDSELWAYLDLVLDMALSEDSSTFSILNAAFDQLTLTFANFPNFQVMPIFCHFLTVPCYCDQTQQILFNSVDKKVMTIPMSLNTIAIRVLLTQSTSPSFNLSLTTLLIISKLVFFDELSIPDMKLFMELIPSFFSREISQQDIGALLLAAACALNNISVITSAQRDLLLSLCLDNSIQGAPFSALLYPKIVRTRLDMLSLIADNEQKNVEQIEEDNVLDIGSDSFENQSPLCEPQATPSVISSSNSNFDQNKVEKPQKSEANFTDAFLPLLSNERSDIRASAAHALGIIKHTKAIDSLISVFVEDESPLVSFEAAVSLNIFLKHFAFILSKRNELKESEVEEETGEIQKKIEEIKLAAQKVVNKEKEKNSENIKKSSSNAETVLDAAICILKSIESIGDNEKKTYDNDHVMNLESKIPELFRNSIVSPGLLERYRSNFFEFKD